MGVEVVAFHDCLTVPGLKGCVPYAAVQGDMVGNEAVPLLVVGKSEVFPHLLVEGFVVRRDDVAGKGLEPCGEAV